MKSGRIRRMKNQKGFTFLEVIVVVAILLLLATIVIVNYGGRMEQAKIDKTQIQIAEISKAIELYKIDNGFYPTTDQGLMALVERPTSSPEPNEKKWKQLFDNIPKDAWDNEFVYIQPGTHKNFDLFSYGPDGVESEDDITNWVKETDQ